MLRLLRSTALLLFAIAVTGCATTMNVSSHVERGLDMSLFRTYDWGPADTLPTGDPRLDANPFFKDHLQGAVEKEMASRGFRRTERQITPDLLIHYHASINERVDVNRVDKERGYCYTDDCQSGVIRYEAGTLVLDVIDARSNRLIWRGWAQDSVEDALKHEDKMASQINEAVTRMFAMFPRGLAR